MSFSRSKLTAAQKNDLIEYAKKLGYKWDNTTDGYKNGILTRRIPLYKVTIHADEKTFNNQVKAFC